MTLALLVLLLAPPFNITVTDEQTPGLSLRTIRVTADYPFSPDEVWEVVTRYDDYRKFLSHVKESRTEKVEGNVTTTYFVVDPPWLPKFWDRVRIEASGAKDRISWSSLAGNIDVNEGTFRLIPRPDGKGTRVEMEGKLDPGHMIPQWTVVWAAKKVLPTTFNRFASRVRLNIRQKAWIKLREEKPGAPSMKFAWPKRQPTALSQ